MVVGDDAQSIYSWRGANFQNILAFPQRYPNAQVFKIEMNYRSVPEILRGRERRHRRQRAAVPQRAERHAPTNSIEAGDGRAERRRASRRSSSRSASSSCATKGIELDEIAVLYRSHYHAVELQLELSRRGIPYQITSGIRFFEQAHIKDVAAFIRFVANPRDEVAFKRMVQAPARDRWQERGKLVARLGKIARTRDARRHRFLERAPACRCRSARARQKIVATTGRYTGRDRA